MYSKTPLRLAMIPDTTMVDGFKYSLDPVWRSIYDERIEPHLQEYRDYPDHLSNMVHFIIDDPNTALYDGYIPIKSSKEYQDCLIVVTEGEYYKHPYGWPFPKFSPFLDIFNFYISEFIEKGSWDAITNKYSPRSQICPNMSGKPIDFSSCFTAFLILICGSILALLLFALEFATKPFDHMLDGIRKTLGDKSNNENPFNEIKGMDKDQMEFTIISQRDIIKNMEMELSMYKKAIT